MATPSYARPTASSTLKASPKSSRASDPEAPKSTPKKLKRPSTLTIEHRQTIIYNADLYPIRPLNPAKPCPLTTIPSELRTVIYTYALDPYSAFQHPRQTVERRRDQPPRYIWPCLLHVCRAIRIEAAYTYYTLTPFTFPVSNLNFSPVRKWVDTLPRAHQALLSKNKAIRIDVNPYVRHTHIYPPKDYLFDAPIHEHWKACEPFGNLYSISSDLHRKQFILFCRLAGWWLFCSQPGQRDVCWTYTFQEEADGNGRFAEVFVAKMFTFIGDHVTVVALPRVRRAWTRNKHRARMKREALSFVTALDECFGRVAEDVGMKNWVLDWQRKLRVLKTFLESW
ncbi:hypothetical protein BKA66DRAFT_452808 [Pyrenochaeta sp. MPI-SDFR-AT-0127]|nr:hypothetical protein BKA66DRAFT_452808 [Pyrenochaeta sp. MPI-SDFR-AT-0127]